MMKCQGKKTDGSPCAFEKDGKFHFCPECGSAPASESSADETPKSIPCPGQNGEACGSPITAKFKFCPACGWKINPDVFKNHPEVCKKCGHQITGGQKFCAECGTKVTTIHGGLTTEKREVVKRSVVPETQDDGINTLTSGSEKCTESGLSDKSSGITEQSQFSSEINEGADDQKKGHNTSPTVEGESQDTSVQSTSATSARVPDVSIEQTETTLKEPGLATDQPPTEPAKPTDQVPIKAALPTNQVPIKPALPTDQAPSRPGFPTNQAQAVPALPTDQAPIKPALPTDQAPSRPGFPTNQAQAVPALSTDQAPIKPALPTDQAPSRPGFPTNQAQAVPALPTDQATIGPTFPTDQAQAESAFPTDQDCSERGSSVDANNSAGNFRQFTSNLEVGGIMKRQTSSDTDTKAKKFKNGQDSDLIDNKGSNFGQQELGKNKEGEKLRLSSIHGGGEKEKDSTTVSSGSSNKRENSQFEAHPTCKSNVLTKENGQKDVRISSGKGTSNKLNSKSDVAKQEDDSQNNSERTLGEKPGRILRSESGETKNEPRAEGEGKEKLTSAPDLHANAAEDAPKSSGSEQDSDDENAWKDGANMESQQTDKKSAGGKSKKKKKKKKKYKKMDGDSSGPGKESQPPRLAKLENAVAVEFHILVSEHWKMNPEKEEVCIHFHSELLGGWNRGWQMKRIKSDAQKDAHYVCTVDLPEDVKQETFKYKYAVHGKIVTYEEIYLLKKHTNEGQGDRLLNLSSKRKPTQGIYHQYDGYIYPPKTDSQGFVQKAKNYVKSLTGTSSEYSGFVDGTRTAAKIFLPSKEEVVRCLCNENPTQVVTAEVILETTLNVLADLTPKMLVQNIQKIDPKFKEKIFKEFFEPLRGHLLKLETEDQSKNCLQLVLASFLILLAWECDMSHVLDHVVFCSLLPRPNAEHTKCPNFEALKKHFTGRNLGKLSDALRKTINQHEMNFSALNESCLSRWLYILPLFHFLGGHSEPFKTVFSPEHRRVKWWGFAELGRSNETLKKFNNWSITAEQIINDLEPLFDVDYLLPRALLGSMSLEKVLTSSFVDKIPPEVTAAFSFYFLDTNLNWSQEGLKTTMKYLLSYLADMQRKRSGSDASTRPLDQQLSFARMNLVISRDVLRASIGRSYVTNSLLIEGAADLFMASLWECPDVSDMRDIPPHLQKNLKDFKLFVHQQVGSTSNDILEWMQEKFKFSSVHDVKLSLHLWNVLLGLTVPPMFAEEWKKSLLDEFEQILSKLNPRDCLKVHMMDKEGASSLLEEKMTKAAFRAFECVQHDSSIYCYGNEKFGLLMSELMDQNWPKTEYEESRLIFVLTWRPLKQYFQRYATENYNKLFTGDCIVHIVQAVSLLQDMVTKLATGSIQIAFLKFILNHSASFLDLWAITQTSNSAEQEQDDLKVEVLHLENVLKTRNREIKECEEFLSKMKMLLDMSTHIKCVKLDDLSQQVEQMELHFEKGCVSDICKPRPSKSCTQSLENYQPEFHMKTIPGAVLQIVPKLRTLKESYIFLKIWEKQSAGVGADMDYSAAVLEVWQSTEKEWNTLCAQFSDGTVTFSKAQSHVEVFRKDYEKIKQEFTMMCLDSTPQPWIDERLNQLKRYEQLFDYQKAADIILDIKEDYGITGDFSPVEAIKSLVANTNEPMKTMSESVMKTCQILEGLNDDAKQDCIKAYKDSRNLIDWLRSSMPGGLKELKVFVDLAFISAGEEPMEIHKVNIFYAATTAFAPLIFSTPSDCTYSTFLENCELVWNELNSDKDLPTKLRDSSRQVTWLQEVKQSHGSVEVTALTQAGMINTKGLYRIGNLDKVETVSDLTLSNVISLHVTQSEEGSSKKYTFEQLLDLQSRLMLVAGQAEKGKENVDLFIMVLDGIIRLAKTYIQLCSDGCVLFNCWRGKFLCGTDRKVCTFLEFGHDDSLETLKGHHSPSDGVEAFIISLANELEEFHGDWLQYLGDKRNQYKELNFFTIDQLVFLQKELIKLGSSEEPSYLIYPILSLVKADCTEKDIIEAMKAAQDLVFEKDEQEPISVNKPDDMEVDSDPVQAFIDAMLESDFSEKLAREALAAMKDPKDIDQGIVWCMEHEEEFQDETEAPERKESSVDNAAFGFTGWQVGEESVSSTAVAVVRNVSRETSSMNDISVKMLNRNLESVWRNFLSTVSSSVADYLSLEHLGIILQQLAQAADVLNLVLHVYKHTEDEPLPQPDEVLLCTAQTTLDQVDIFLRRAFFHKRGKVYVMADADSLQYELQEKMEKKLKEYSDKSDSSYNLVIICSTESEFKARIVAALEKNRCPPPPQNLDEIKQYLLSKFSQVSEKAGQKSASNLDFSTSTVRVIKSKRAGVGKTLYKKRHAERLKHLNPRMPATSVSVHLYEKSVSTSDVAENLIEYTLQPEFVQPRIFHLDISYEVQEGVDHLLFSLLVLGCITNNTGKIWLRNPLDLYLIETIPIVDSRLDRRTGQHLVHPLLKVLPDVYCWSPLDSLRILTGDVKPEEYSGNDKLFDEEEYRSEVYQRPFQYLKSWSEKTDMANINPKVPGGPPEECLTVLLRHCGVQDPAWSELHNFVWFLNTQLRDFEKSVFCSALILEDLPGFPTLVLHFLIQMSRDFATRSLVMSEESPLDELGDEERAGDLAQFQMKRTWESSPHPYIFFNPDGVTMTFLGFNIERNTGNMVDHQTKAVLETGLVRKDLQDALVRNRVNINENFDQMPRIKRLEKLCSVMPGVDYVHDPDETYELTTDNVKKILAIYMRFRCGIPVIIMGETGCGKTRLVKFMCSLQCPPGSNIENMVIMKVHGGTTSADIKRKVTYAGELATENRRKNASMYTVLFFDEANTTEAIGLIKEIMCDGTMDGKPFAVPENLKIVAACNPYRKHSDELIQRLEKAGLGYHVDADKTTDKLGRVPMRRLVYRVQPLPQSMLPLVWDFGQLNIQVEELYIRQMVNRYVRNGQLPSIQDAVHVISRILIACQEFMRNQDDECSFVSLRDVDRTLSVMAWFYEQSVEDGKLFDLIDQQLPTEEEDEEESDETKLPSDMTKSLILALSVCYRASLRSREEFDKFIIQYFQAPCEIPGGEEEMTDVIDACQTVFVEEVQLEDNIAKNLALKENLFMMVVCIELRIPLFLVGKPGSSKSLAKTIVADAMQGTSARSALFKELKQAQMVSFQCSPLATAEGIVGTFRQCARYQKAKDLERFVSIVVLDEVGLAEDSPRMPLKTLHPLLEDGCQGDEKPDPYKKVAFIGISNWALDPAKMNRGILVQREVPNDDELIESAKGICANNALVKQKIKTLLPQLAKAYRKIFDKAQRTRREFFGLRDYYSLVKMVYAFAESKKRAVCWHQLTHAIMRNFGGLDNLDPVKEFKKLVTTVKKDEAEHEDDPDSTTIGLIEAGLLESETSSENRYLLLLTENYGALSILQQQILTKHKVITIFGSSFPKDQEYTQVCRNINRIKVCMETGSTVILLNLENLYESLYDALNQYYARLGGERFVDLGLGTHRVKCRVHKKFRLIVVAEKQKVYDEFPIPLINRLEKHFLTLSNMMTDEQMKMSKKLGQWAVDFVTPKTASRKKKKPDPGEAFMGFHPDTTSAIVLQVFSANMFVKTDDTASFSKSISPTGIKLDFLCTKVYYRDLQVFTVEMLKECQKTLLWVATPASVFRLTESKLYQEADTIVKEYFHEQKHDDLFQYLHWKLIEEALDTLQAQVSTHSKLLTDQEKEDLTGKLDLMPQNVLLLTLQSFDTEQQFAQQIKNYVARCEDGQKLLLIQCGSGDKNQSLIKSAQYCVLDELQEHHQFAVVFIVQLPSIAGACFTGFQAGNWHSLHLDELRPSRSDMPTIEQLQQSAPSSVLEGRMTRQPPSNVQPLERLLSPMDYEENLMGPESLQYTVTPSEEPMDVESQQAVDTEDIVLEDKPPSDVQVAPYFLDLLLPCIQSAASLIKDDELDTRRSTKRIEILLTLLEHRETEDGRMFMKGLSLLIINLLKKKEEDQMGGSQTDWLVKEAAKPEAFRKAGTFRRATMQCLEDKMTPILAEVMAFLDTNRNLDFMFKDEVAPWTRKLWLDLLLNTNMCMQQLTNGLTESGHYNEGEVVTHHFGLGGPIFSIQTPFFWLLYQIVRQALAQAQKEELWDPLENVSNIVTSMPYGKVLELSVNECDKAAILRAYLGDFISTVYPGRRNEEIELLCDALLCASRQTGKDLDELALVEAIVCLHIIHTKATERFHSFIEVVQVWPEVVDADLEMKAGGHVLATSTQEMTLDVLSLTLLLEQLEPRKDQLNSENGREDWMERVKTYLPVIDRILKSEEHDIPYGHVCCRSLVEARYRWMKVMALKLFIESFSSNPKIQLQGRIMPLWTLLGDDADLTKLVSLEKIEKFLKSFNKQVVKRLAGKQGACSHCESQFETPPIELPCKDQICLKCFSESQITKDFECPKCHKSIPKTFEAGKGSSKQSEIMNEYKAYQKCCNSFLVSVVSKLCFGGTDAPESPVVERIFSYITRKIDHGRFGEEARVFTKEMSVFDDMIDPSPVVRSFLLQLLIHKSEETVHTHLQNFFLQAKTLCEQGREGVVEDIANFSMLVIHCFEDFYHEKGSSLDIHEEMKCVCFSLSEGRKNLLCLDLNMQKLFTIAHCRYGLSMTAKYLHTILVAKTETRTGIELGEVLKHTSRLLEVQETEWPKKFLVKQLCREFGTDSYYDLCAQNVIPALAVEDPSHVNECPDRYVVCLDYQNVREAVAKVLLGEEIKHLKQATKGKEYQFLLALHREVTMKNIKPTTNAEAEQMKDRFLAEIKEFVEKTKEKVKNKDLALRLIANQFGCPGSCLNVGPQQSVRAQSTVCLLIHVYLSVTHFNKCPNFLKPLTDLIQNPAQMRNMFLPTMPQDDVDSVRQIVQTAETAVGGSANLTVYKCPNGHPYFIGECGRPASTGKCNMCGLDIGGQSYVSARGNHLYGQHDMTLPGHILGRASDRSTAYPRERHLDGAECAVLRFFVHAALLLGTEADPQAVSGLVTPGLQGHVSNFFWEHIQKDIEIISQATGKGIDDVFLLLHFICHQINELDRRGRMPDQILNTKQNREQWENHFAKSFIVPSLQHLDTCLSRCNERIVNDKRIGQDKLLAVLYEVDKTGPKAYDKLHEYPVVWRFRARITLEHFLREFHLQIESRKNKNRLKVLSLFKKEHPFLKALHHLPGILRLQLFLMSKYRRRLDRARAKEIKILEIAQDEDNAVSVLDLLPDFTAAWECVKEALHSYGCWTEHDGLIRLPEDYKQLVINERSPLAVLLPSTRGPGICSYMLLEFLFRHHNEFMQKYCGIIKKRFEDLPEVSMRKLHSNHLVCYNPDQDVLPLVLANCNYSFELGKGTTVDYDFEGFEYQLKEVLLQAKSRVEAKSHIIPIETMVYSADSTNAIVFRDLRDKIPQESLPQVVKNQICLELNGDLPNICDSISNLNITVSFLKSLGGDAAQPLQTFMKDVLKMKQTVNSQKARQFCRYRHAQSLWLLLSCEKSSVLAHHGQDAFDNLTSELKASMSSNAKNDLKSFCQALNLEKLECLLQEMFDCLLLRVAQPVDPFDQDAVQVENFCLRDILVANMESPLYNQESSNNLHENDLAAFPEEVQGKHIPDAWLVVLQEISRRRKEIR